MTARGLRPLMESLAGRVRDSGGAASALASEVAAADAPRATAEEARNFRRDRRSSRSSMGVPAESGEGGIAGDDHITPDAGVPEAEEEGSRQGAKTPRRPPEERTTDCTDNTDKEEITRQPQRLCLSLLSLSVISVQSVVPSSWRLCALARTFFL